MDTEKDWQGRDVPKPTDPNSVYPVWEITTEPTTAHYDSYLTRGWQSFLEFVECRIEDELDGREEDELREGITFKIRLVDKSHEEMTPTED